MNLLNQYSAKIKGHAVDVAISRIIEVMTGTIFGIEFTLPPKIVIAEARRIKNSLKPWILKPRFQTVFYYE